MELHIPFVSKYDNAKKYRRLGYQMIAKALITNKEAKRCKLEEQQKICRSIEKGCYKKAKYDNDEFIEEFYNVLISKICFILDSEISGSSVLCEKILKKEIKLSEIANMSSHELEPNEEAKKIITSIELRESQTLSIKTTKLYQCSKCKIDCRIVPKQTRSMDEANGYIVSCPNCSKVWKVE